MTAAFIGGAWSSKKDSLWVLRCGGVGVHGFTNFLLTMLIFIGR